jgi:hypothetical protein
VVVEVIEFVFVGDSVRDSVAVGLGEIVDVIEFVMEVVNVGVEVGDGD